MMLQDVNPDISSTVVEVVKLGLTTLIAASIAWFFARRKNTAEASKLEAEAGKTEADIIKMYLGIIADLQREIEDWIAKVKALRVNVKSVEDVNDELKDTIKTVQRQENEKLESLQRLFRSEKEKLFESISAVLRIARAIEDEIDNHPEYNSLKRETIRIVEMLTFIKGKLDPTNHATIHLTE